MANFIWHADAGVISFEAEDGEEIPANVVLACAALMQAYTLSEIADQLGIVVAPSIAVARK
jgi:hypothetical protein